MGRSELERRDLPFAVAEMLDAVGRPATALDVGCGSGRLTLALARRGATAAGIDTSEARLAQARRRAAEAGADVEWLCADMNEPLPFPDGRFEAVVSRLSLMLARDPARVLREAARVLQPSGVVVTAVWADIAENPWFGEPRAAVADVLGSEAAEFARAFGRLGDLEQLEQLHRAAGYAQVQGYQVSDVVTAARAADHWAFLAGAIGHYRKLDAALPAAQVDEVCAALARRLERFRQDGELRIPRRMLLVSARLGFMLPEGGPSERPARAGSPPPRP